MAEEKTEQEKNTDIPPALTLNEWRNIRSINDEARRKFVDASQVIDRPHAAIAILNDALHGEDVRKLTREHVKLLRQAAEWIDAADVARRAAGTAPTLEEITDMGQQYDALHEMADVLESYLPPEPV